MNVDPRTAEQRRKEKERLIIKEGTELLRRRKLREAQEKRDEQRRLQTMLASYQPWGRPGGGAPNQPDVRRKPLGLHQPNQPHSQLNDKQGLDRTLPKPPVFRKSDPLLRYQFHEPVRRSIDNHVRYRRPYHEQLQYKQQLDRLVAEKRRLLAEERRQDKDLWNMTCSAESPWGRPGPGGTQWRDPTSIGQHFLHSLVLVPDKKPHTRPRTRHLASASASI